MKIITHIYKVWIHTWTEIFHMHEILHTYIHMNTYMPWNLWQLIAGMQVIWKYWWKLCNSIWTAKMALTFLELEQRSTILYKRSYDEFEAFSSATVIKSWMALANTELALSSCSYKWIMNKHTCTYI